MSKPVMQIRCVSHQCLLWGERNADTGIDERRHLDQVETAALQRAHMLIHSKRPLTADHFAKDEFE
ncbi:hypothetical protein [Nocardia wallacei]|uniref:hypothetical protein n=1 Tax=Nocardia wallacei TaxID=480035 RepID=UPI0024566E0D|nr:hypothetical protein [Nocardia wallacei]